MSMEELFSKEVLRWRSVRVLSCCLLFQLIGPMAWCIIFYTVSQGIINPFSILYNVCGMWLFPTRLAIPFVCFVILSHVYNKSFTVSAWVPITRWESWRRVLSISFFLKSSMIMLSCALLTNFYVSLANPDLPSILIPCQLEDAMCNKRKAFILYMGLINGAQYAYFYLMDNGNLLVPATVYPSRLQRVKSKLSISKVKEAYSRHGPSLISFLVLGIVLNLLNGSSSWMDGVVILDIPLMVTMLMATILWAISITFYNDIFYIFITEPIEIPLTSVEESNPETDTDSWRLSHALSSGGLLQLLAFMDLKSLAALEPRNFVRRSQIYAISQPGGHPRNWLGIMNPSLNLIRKFTDRLKRHNCPEEIPKVPEKPVDPAVTATDINKNAVVKPPTVSLKERLLKILDSLKRYPVFAYFLAELPDATNRSIFAEALPIIWAVQAFGDLVASSFTEDKYGVAQRNVPDILAAFLQLQKVVDGLSRGTISKRAGTSDSLPAEFKLRRALRSALRSALYTITTTFGPSILELKLSAEYQSKLQLYLDFKEG
ncbi:nucleoporin NDC1-like [Macrobrachium nipponense]|uniref:nucleoporin NDC1-like n=1 Tax=Macrobrachium nipponense TaxID=159736 RepID=UPI0030C8B791